MYTVALNTIMKAFVDGRGWKSSFFLKKNYLIQDLSAKTIPYFRPKRLKTMSYVAHI